MNTEELKWKIFTLSGSLHANELHVAESILQKCLKKQKVTAEWITVNKDGNRELKLPSLK